MLNNPMLTALNRNSNSQSITNFKQFMQMMRSGGNPQMMLQLLMGQNPQVKQMMDFVNANGGDPKALFYKMAEEKGVNPEEILEQLK